MHLWEIDHPYYCEEHNFLARPGTYDNVCESWAEFMECEAATGDLDMNLLFRWDWKPADPAEGYDHHVLMLFFMLQRKGLYISFQINVEPRDERFVREWLRPRWEKLTALWDPVSHDTNHVH